MMREEITIMAVLTMYESVVSLREAHTGGLLVAKNKNQWIDLARDLDIDARQRRVRFIDPRMIDRASKLQRDMRTREGQ